jgi:hypothetical protein
MNPMISNGAPMRPILAFVALLVLPATASAQSCPGGTCARPSPQRPMLVRPTALVRLGSPVAQLARYYVPPRPVRRGPFGRLRGR